MTTLKNPTIIIMLLSAALTAGADPRTINDAIYSETQAESGENLYAEHCLTCHDKKYFRPVLRRWEGQPLGVFYTVMVTSMPQSNPGALALDEYADILAYILSLSRYPAGDDPLQSEPEALNEVMIAERK
jgi:mono/diheme cytochrome c family protein